MHAKRCLVIGKVTPRPAKFNGVASASLLEGVHRNTSSPVLIVALLSPKELAGAAACQYNAHRS